MSRMTDWDRIRHDFPVTEKCAYLMSAAMSPLPRPVWEAVRAGYETLFRDGDIHWPDDMDRYRAMCRRVARMLKAGPEDVAFAPNTSTAMALLGLSLKQNSPSPFNVISMEDEFPASTLGFEYLKIPMRYVRPVGARYPIRAILDLADDRTLAVVTSYVQYCTGFRQDLDTLGGELSRRGILFIVNATQAWPIYPVDVQAMHIDALAASLHKWGLTGHVGSLFYTSPAFRERFPPPMAGWLSVDPAGGDGIHIAKNAPFRLLSSAHRYEFGTFNLIPVLALDAALDYFESIGLEAVRARIGELADELIRGLEDLGIEVASPVARPEERSGIVSFSLGEKNAHYLKKFEEAGIYVSLRAGLVRVSINIFNNSADIRRLLDVVRAEQSRP
jgi:cysteine desulfurase/selenocysteine lyase